MIFSWRKIIVLICLSILVGYSGDLTASYISGEGTFYSNDEDSLGFLKKQLLFNAFKDVISKEFNVVGLDAALFWEKFDNKFEEYFQPIKDKLEKEYKLDEEQVDTLNAKQKHKNTESYLKRLRLKRYALKSRFGNVSKAISSYYIKRMNRSTKNPNSRYLSIQAKVNRKLLSKIYYSFIRDGDVCHLQNFYLSTEFDLDNMTWIDLGVEIESDFTKVVRKYWKNWLTKNLVDYTDNVVNVDPVLYDKLSERLKIPSKASSDLAMNQVFESGDQEGQEKSDNVSVNSFWMKLKIKITKVEEDKLLKFRKIEFKGDFVIIDMRTNSLVYHYDFIKEKYRFKVQDNYKLSSEIASLIYKMPIPKLTAFVKIIRNYPNVARKFDLKIIDVKNMNELITIKNLISKSGQHLRFTPDIRDYDGKNATLIMSYQGEEAKILRAIMTLNNKKINKTNDFIKFNMKKNPYALLIKRN